MNTANDKLEDIFSKREQFMHLIKDKFSGTYPEWPVDLSSKKAQSTCRETALKGVEEMFEALGHLKNWKSHRQTDMPDINREEFLEEIVDALNYFFSLIITAGFDEDDLIAAYIKKHDIIIKRIEEGY